MTKPRRCLLIILDGWGIDPPGPGNAVELADTPFLDHLVDAYPCTRLQCAGQDVGLPDGIMGNSEVGHLNIGAGRIVYQDLLRIDRSIADGSFFRNDVLVDAVSQAARKRSAMHFMGLVSDGGVHSQFAHLLALLELARQKEVDQVYVHAILDGRDTPPHSGVKYLARLQKEMTARGVGKIATVCGRYYAMDRDNRWDRVEKAYRLYVSGEGRRSQDPVAAVKDSYERGETDEFVKPIAVVETDNSPIATVSDGDGILFFNFRADRAREITRAFNDSDFDEFDRDPAPTLNGYACMTLYDEKFRLPVAYPPVQLKNGLGETISREGLRQLRIAETEKYAHVTYFFNGGRERPFLLEERCLVPSPRDVDTYDLKPEMSAVAVTDALLSRLNAERHGMIVLNFANMDMVGHTGDLKAAIKACETVDRCVQRIVAKAKALGFAILITADHGNSEKMLDEKGHPHTAHTVNPVPLILVDDTRREAVLRSTRLADIAPTMLTLMGLKKPAEMTGQSLLKS